MALTPSEAANQRVSSIRLLMKQQAIEALLITHLPHIKYLSNFSGSNATVLITAKSVFFFTDDRYAEQIKTELYQVRGLKTFVKRDVWGTIQQKQLLKGCSTLGFDSTKTTVAAHAGIQKAIKPTKLKKVVGLVETVVVPKFEHEVANIRKAASITAKVYDYVLGFVKPGMREIDVAAEISYQGRKLGSEGDAFEIIFVAGDHSAFVHGRASERKIKKGDVITLDFGCKVNGFNSDQTRTFSVGKVSTEIKQCFNVVSEAFHRALDAVKPGMTGAELDAVARNVIKKAGYGEFFSHSLGHGLGIEVHEAPGISAANTKGLIPLNSVITIEPGIYIPGKFGMRLEDDVHVTEHGPVGLNSSPRELIQLT